MNETNRTRTVSPPLMNWLVGEKGLGSASVPSRSKPKSKPRPIPRPLPDQSQIKAQIKAQIKIQIKIQMEAQIKAQIKAEIKAALPESVYRKYRRIRFGDVGYEELQVETMGSNGEHPILEAQDIEDMDQHQVKAS